jgi:Protein of unknown function (DUF1653)
VGAGERPCRELIGVARHTETDELYSLTVSGGTVVATPATGSHDTWLGDSEVLAANRNAIAGRWRHFKGGIYNFVARATEATTGDDLIVYTSADKRVWIRPERMVEEMVRREGRTCARFTRM